MTTIIRRISMHSITRPRLIQSYQSRTTSRILMPIVTIIQIHHIPELKALLHRLRITRRLRRYITTERPITGRRTLQRRPRLMVTSAKVRLPGLPGNVRSIRRTQRMFVVALLLLMVNLFTPTGRFATVHCEVSHVTIRTLCYLAPTFFHALVPYSSVASVDIFETEFLS